MQGKGDRRSFLRGAGACTVGAMAGVGLLQSEAPRAAAQEDHATRRALPRMFSGCCAYSYRRQLMAGQMTMEDFIRKAVDLRVDGVDITVYYLKSTDPSYLTSLRHFAYQNGVPLSGAACGASMVQPDAARRADVINDIKKWVDVTDRLGASHLRIFAGNPPPGATLQQATEWTVESMKRACDYSGEKGITLGLEDHLGVSQSAEVCLEIMHKIGSPYAGINLDITHFVPTSTQDAYAQISACVPYATNTHIRDRFDDDTPINLERVWKIFADGGFRGYMSLEYEPKPGGPDVSGSEIPRMLNQIRSLCRKYSSTEL